MSDDADGRIVERSRSRCGMKRMVSARRLPPLLLALLVVCVTGCGSSRITGDSRDAVAAVESRMRGMFNDLERGRYTAACEAFTIRSRYGLAIASALDGHQSDSPCSDVFVVAGALGHLGFSAAGHALLGGASKAGLVKVVNLPGREINELFSGIGSTAVSPVVGELQIEGGKARYRGFVVAVYEAGRWLLEAGRPSKTTYAEVKEVPERRCDRSSESSKSYHRLCHLMQAVLVGEVLSGTEHREFNRLLPHLYESPSRATFSG